LFICRLRAHQPWEGQAHTKSPANARSAFDLDQAIVVADDAQVDRQSKPLAFADGFSGKERIGTVARSSEASACDRVAQSGDQ
jgi:hypothetical protein